MCEKSWVIVKRQIALRSRSKKRWPALRTRTPSAPAIIWQQRFSTKENTSSPKPSTAPCSN